mgnify:FL=1
MSLRITSEKINNPFLVDLLEKLSICFRKIEHDFFVIGATARDIIIQEMLNTSSRRKTRDLDLAIAVPNWQEFDKIKKNLIADGFEKDKDKQQRFYYGDYEIDIVPYGYVAKDDDNIYWPPEETIAMSVKGFDEALSDSITVSIDDRFDVKIASLHGLFLLKLNAWMDRHLTTNKDAEDMSFILDNYLMANLDREAYMEVYDWEEFDEFVAGGYWLANDLAKLLNKEQLLYYADKIDEEVLLEERSHLISQMLNSQSGLTYDQVRRTWQTISEVFRSTPKEEQ